ncbi:MAG: hypothetical protein H6603_05420 [Flavobacteriales bacterium]|nr:hypothetical protein [Flavobacteriales bacterium]MCB9191585.1 hypothetical protein [Flavobacteriales bacterium]MCB9204400.1 hypothetical protein [Flavobacteriales bacterium]
MSDLDSERKVQQMSFQLVPGGRLELMADEFGCNICLDRIVVDHITGGEIQISQPVPLVTLN